jgi:hypothetical protein
VAQIKDMYYNMWRTWAKALGEKGSDNNIEADRIAVVRTIIVLSYIFTNCFIVAGVIRHW